MWLKQEFDFCSDLNGIRSQKGSFHIKIDVFINIFSFPIMSEAVHFSEKKRVPLWCKHQWAWELCHLCTVCRYTDIYRYYVWNWKHSQNFVWWNAFICVSFFFTFLSYDVTMNDLRMCFLFHSFEPIHALPIIRTQTLKFSNFLLWTFREKR